jgi:hypothetical protein
VVGVVAGGVGVVGVVVVLVLVVVVVVVVGVVEVLVVVVGPVDVVGEVVGVVLGVEVLDAGRHCETERLLTWLASLVSAERRLAFTVPGRLATWLARFRVALRTSAQWPALSADET